SSDRAAETGSLGRVNGRVLGEQRGRVGIGGLAADVEIAPPANARAVRVLHGDVDRIVAVAGEGVHAGDGELAVLAAHQSGGAAAVGPGDGGEEIGGDGVGIGVAEVAYNIVVRPGHGAVVDAMGGERAAGDLSGGSASL